MWLPGISFFPKEVNIFSSDFPFDFIGLTLQGYIIFFFGTEPTQRFGENNRSLCKKDVRQMFLIISMKY